MLLAACSEPTESIDPNAIRFGTVLPFTGKNSTVGQNIEQAMMLAVEDVNRAGGVNGREIRLLVGDSNSGSERGLNSLVRLLYEDEVSYVIGPEENELANEIVPDIKALDIINVLAGYSAPDVERVTRSGAWLRLTPAPLPLGCSYSELAKRQGVGSANAIVAQDDFYQDVASEFVSEFADVGGKVRPSLMVDPNSKSAAELSSRALTAGAERTVLLVDPIMASSIVTEWALGEQEGSLLLGPTLRTPGFLHNVPPRALDKVHGLSPTLSLTSECEEKLRGYQGPVECGNENATAFSRHFVERWDGEAPFPAANFYYDAVVLLAMGLNYAEGMGQPNPTPSELHELILEMSGQPDRIESWEHLDDAFATLKQGTAVAYRGAAAEYAFDEYGAAQHLVFDMWQVDGFDYVDEGKLQTRCQNAVRGIQGNEAEPLAIDRRAVPDSPFKPLDLEASIDRIVEALTAADAASSGIAILVPEYTGSWDHLKTGADRAIKDMGVLGRIETPTLPANATPEVYDEALGNLFRTRQEQGYTTIALAPVGTGLESAVDSAKQAGISVVTVQNDLPESERDLHLGTDDAAAGRTAAGTLQALLPGGAGTVFILGTNSETWTDGLTRTAAAKAALESAGYAVVVDDVGANPGDAQTNYDDLRDLMANAAPPLVGVLGLFSTSFRGAEIVAGLGYAPGDIKIVAFDLESETQSYLRSGYIQATHVPRYYYTGYLTPFVLVSLEALGAEETLDLLGNELGSNATVDTGVDVVTASQLDEYTEFLQALGIDL
jgi:neutral amino acid transport system substrate-binding protein